MWGRNHSPNWGNINDQRFRNRICKEKMKEPNLFNVQRKRWGEQNNSLQTQKGILLRETAINRWEIKEFSWISPYRTPLFLLKKNGLLSGIIQVRLMACQSRAAGPLTSPLEIDFFWLHYFICTQSFLSSAHIITANNKSRAPFPLKSVFCTALLFIMTVSLSVSRTKGSLYFSFQALKQQTLRG